ncbi:hypothetical protein GCM10009611_26550 [Arthrobacter roseus]
MQLAGAVMLQIASPPFAFPPQHYAFLLDEQHVDRAYAKITHRSRDHWADPQWTRLGETNTDGHGCLSGCQG